MQRIKEAVLAVDPSARVILFGSQARGDAHKESDWDVLVLTNESKPDVRYKTRFYKQMYAVELENDIVISPLIKNKNEWERLKETWLFKEVKEQGQVI